MKPFLKWAGGKTQLLSELKKLYPANLGGEIDKYCEPFVGGGAVLFDILFNYQLKEVLINDANPELTNTYQQIKYHVNQLLIILLDMQNLFLQQDETDRKIYYYEQRTIFNQLQLNDDEQTNIHKAALFIFLNKTCFNGLYRVNKNGQFNVPMGSYKNPLICDESNLMRVHQSLQNVKIKTGDYRECLTFIDANTFVYIDPPYRPLNATSNFTSYHKTDFNDEDQIALSCFVNKINSKGAKIVISNSDPKNYDESDNFFDDLYSRYLIRRVHAKRAINSKADSRGNITELLITNFNNDDH